MKELPKKINRNEEKYQLEVAKMVLKRYPVERVGIIEVKFVPKGWAGKIDSLLDSHQKASIQETVSKEGFLLKFRDGQTRTRGDYLWVREGLHIVAVVVGNMSDVRIKAYRRNVRDKEI
jgi:hypothetical protein